MLLQLQRVTNALWKKNSGRLFATLSALAVLASCDSGSSSSGTQTPQVPTEDHFEIVAIYSIGTAESLMQLATIAVLAVQESQNESRSQFLPICEQGSAQLNLPVGAAKSGDEIRIDFDDCRTAVLNDVATGTMTLTIAGIDATSGLTFGARSSVDMLFMTAPIQVNLEYFLDFKVDARGETLSILSADADGHLVIDDIREGLPFFQITKETDLETKRFSVDFNTDIHSELLNDEINCQTQTSIAGDISYYLSDYDYIADSGAITCDSDILGVVNITASESGVDAIVLDKSLNFTAAWQDVIEGPLFYPGTYAMSANYHSSIRIPARSIVDQSTRVEIKQMQDIHYYFDSNDNTAILIQKEAYEDPDGGGFIDHISLIDLSSLEVLARIEEPEYIQRAFLENDLLFVSAGERIDTYKVDRLRGLTLQASFNLADHPELSFGYGSWIGLPDINAIFVLNSEANAHNIYRLTYDLDGRIVRAELFHEIPRQTEQVRIYGDGKQLYSASSHGYLTRFAFDDRAALLQQQEYKFDFIGWDLADFAVIHSGRILSIFNTANLRRGTLSTYILGDEGTAEKVEEIDLTINDWVVSFSLTQQGEGLIQWQEGEGSNVTGEYQRFGIGIHGAISLSPVANCEHTDGFTSYRYGNQSIANNAFVAGRSSLVLFPYERTLPQCVAKGLDNHGRLLEGMGGYVASDIHRSIYVFRNEQPGIAMLKHQNNRLEEIGFISMPQISSEIKKLLLSPDGNNLYVLTERSIEVFDIDSEGMLHSTPHAISLGEGSSNSANAVISIAGDRLYVHQSNRATVGSANSYSSDVAIYIRNPLNGELNRSGEISFDEEETKAYEIAQTGPIAISPDDRHLYVVTRYFGKLRIINLSDNASPSITMTYLDPIVHSTAPENRQSVRGLSLASGFSFYMNGEHMQITMDAGSSYANSNHSEVILASFRRNSSNGELELRNAVLRSFGKLDDSPGRALGYLAPQLIGNKLFAIRTYGGAILSKPSSIDVYELDQHGFLLKRETLTSSYFGKGIEQISTWESTKTLIGINPMRETVAAFTLDPI